MCRQNAENMGFRQVEWKDRELLFAWSNDEEVRRQSFHGELISWEEHVRWFESKMRSEDCDLLIWMEDSIDKGILRLDYENDKARVSYSVQKDQRGKGTASRLIGALPAYVREAMPGIHMVEAEVKTENRFSRRIFEKCGYSQEQKADRVVFTMKL